MPATKGKIMNSPIANFRRLMVVAGLMCSMAAAAEVSPSPSFWSTPEIQGYGKIHFLPDSAFKPEKNQRYEIVFSLTKGSKNPDEINSSLDHVARTVNLYVASGVPLSHLFFVAVASGEATSLTLSREAYQKHFGVANPNTDLLKKLRRAGVKVAVCGQAVAEHQFDYSEIDRSVTTSLSALTTITTLEQQGYSLMPL
ncbi:DsrE family protein [Pantoea agglomerans]|uniref:DsrE family protein n=1 Tax=Enterobacter agglomerans TaxID=549 RepID=UPI003C7E30F1